MLKVSQLNTISFTGTNDTKASNRKLTDEEKKEAAKKAVEGGGAVAATSATLSGGKKAGVDLFTKASQASSDLRAGSATVRVATESAGKAKGLWAKCSRAVKSTKMSIIEWGANVKASRFIKPLLESRAFRCCAGALGYGFGIITLITGLGDIANVTSDALAKQLVPVKNN